MGHLLRYYNRLGGSRNALHGGALDLACQDAEFVFSDVVHSITCTIAMLDNENGYDSPEMSCGCLG